MLQTFCSHSPTEVRRFFWFFIVHTPKLTSEEEIVPHWWSFFCIALKWAWGQARCRKSSEILLRVFPYLREPFLSVSKTTSLQPPLKNTSENMLRTLFWKGKFCILCGLSFLSITPFIICTNTKNSSPTSKPVWFFFPNAQNKQNNMRAF